MKRLLLAVLVVVVIVTGLPLVMGMGAMPVCEACGPAIRARAADCLPGAVLVIMAGLLLAFVGRLRVVEAGGGRLGFTAVFERPPRWA